MKKTILIIFVIFLMAFTLSACNNNTPAIKKYYLDDTGNLIAQYSDGTTSDLGSLKDTVANGVEKIEINDDGFYVINNIPTSIKAKLPKSYSIDKDGDLIVTYTDTTNENLGKFGNDSINTIETIAVSNDGFYVLNGIKTNIVAIETYNVTFNTGYSAQVQNQIVKDGYKVDRPQLERTGYVLNGWYCNGEEWHFNTDIVKNDMSLSASWTAKTFIVQFENEKGDNPENITVTFDSAVELPVVDEVEGYSFLGWYYNERPVDVTKWSISDDITLTAKWEAQKYTVTLNANGGEVSPTSIVVEYDKSFSLPVPTNDYGVFVGWIYNNEPFTDDKGKSLNKWTYLDNITVTVDWTIKVYTVEDLKKMNTYLNGEFILMNDINLEDIKWEPVGTKNEPFIGSLNGNGFELKNLSIDTADFNNLNAFGLFGYISEARIYDISIIDFNFISDNISKSYSVGTIAGISVSTSFEADNENAPIKNIKTSGVYSIVKQSSSYPVYAGGVIGKSSSCDFLMNCSNSINISNATYSGGIVGASSTFLYLIDCGNTASINSALYAGGLAGKCGLGFIASRCYNSGEVNSIQASGGIVGSVDTYATFEYCYNTGNISSTTDNTQFGAGGLIGCCYVAGEELPSVEINDSYNKGNVTAPYSGGLCGTTYSIKITNAYNAGTVSGTKYVGGIFANCINGNIKQCLGAGSISGSGVKSTIGVILATQSMTDCYHAYSHTADFYMTGSTYATNIYGSSLYKNDMYWSEYDENTNNGCWVFNNSDLPKLFWE